MTLYDTRWRKCSFVGYPRQPRRKESSTPGDLEAGSPMPTEQPEPSPLTRTRIALGCPTTAAFAALLGVRYHALYNPERGLCRLPRAARDALAELGVNVPQLEREQAAWIAQRGEQLRAALLENRIAGGCDR